MAILHDAFARAYDQATVDSQTTSATCHRHHCTVKSCCSDKAAMGELWLVVFLVLIRPWYIWLLRNCSGNKIVNLLDKRWRERAPSTCWLDVLSFLGRPTSHEVLWTSWRVFVELTRLCKTYGMWWYLGGSDEWTCPKVQYHTFSLKSVFCLANFCETFVCGHGWPVSSVTFFRCFLISNWYIISSQLASWLTPQGHLPHIEKSFSFHINQKNYMHVKSVYVFVDCRLHNIFIFLFDYI